MTVYYDGENEYRRVAEAVASDRGTRVVDSLDDLGDGRVVYVAAPENVSDDVLFSLQRRLDRDGPVDGGFSAVTGYTPDDAIDLYFRDAELAGRHCVLSRYLPGNTSADDDAVVGSTNNRSDDALPAAELAAGSLDSLSVNARGWPIHLTLADGYLCGFPESVDPADYDGQQPYCVVDGEKQCPLDGEIVSAAELAPSHVFMGSCASVIDNNITRLPVHVGTALLAGACSLVGSYKVAHTAPHEVFLHYALLRAEYDLVERTYVLNRHAHQVAITNDPYVGFGRPESSLGGQPSASFDVAVEPETGALEFTDVDAHVLDVTVEDAPVRPGRYYLALDAAGGFDAPLYYVAFPERDGVRVLVYSTRRVESDRLRFTLDDEPVAADDRRVHRASFRNLRENHLFGILDSRAERQFESIQGQLDNVPNAVVKERYDTRGHEAVAARVDQIAGELSSVNDLLVDAVDRIGMFSKTYASRAIDEDAYPLEETCWTCGRTVVVKTAVNPSREVRRGMGVCPRCGYVFDVPMARGDRSPSYPEVCADLLNCDGEETFTVRFENPSDGPADVEYVPIVYHLDDGERREPFEPRSVSRRLEPGEVDEVAFTLDADLLADNTHTMAVNAITNAAIYVGMKVMVVGEKSARQPRYSL